MKDKYYTVKEVAELLSLNRYTVISWIKSGKIKAKDIGTPNRPFYRIDPDVLKEFLK